MSINRITNSLSTDHMKGNKYNSAFQVQTKLRTFLIKQTRKQNKHKRFNGKRDFQELK